MEFNHESNNIAEACGFKSIGEMEKVIKGCMINFGNAVKKGEYLDLSEEEKVAILATYAQVKEREFGNLFVVNFMDDPETIEWGIDTTLRLYLFFEHERSVTYHFILANLVADAIETVGELQGIDSMIGEIPEELRKKIEKNETLNEEEMKFMKSLVEKHVSRK